MAVLVPDGYRVIAWVHLVVNAHLIDWSRGIALELPHHFSQWRIKSGQPSQGVMPVASLRANFTAMGVINTQAIVPGQQKMIALALHLSPDAQRSEEHTSELQSRGHLVCRLLLEEQDGRTVSR